uniref:Uncharacterized protein n=1 Tax=Rhizophora mucronata TaxID=61149 RepID=A0A2P2NS78_RHIMU
MLSFACSRWIIDTSSLIEWGWNNFYFNK